MTKNNLLTEQLRYTGDNKFPTKINLCSYKKDSITFHKDIEFEHLKGLMNEDEINWVQVTGMQEQLCIIQGKSYVLTFAEKETDFFNDIISALNKNTLKIRHRQSDYLLSVILNSSMANFMSVLTTMEDELEDMEEALIVPHNPDAPGIENIQKYRKNYRIIKKCIFPMKEHINKLFHADNELLNEQQRPFFNDVNDHLQFVLQTMESCRQETTNV